VQELIEGHGMGEVLSVSGHPTWPFLNLHGHGDCDYWDIQTLYQQEMFARGVLCLGAHNLTYAHSAEDIETLLAVYDEVFAVLRAAVYDGEMKERLHCEPLQPLFRARGD
jgi:glutamate-1-semialdehyde 2,1-aminomutase